MRSRSVLEFSSRADHPVKLHVGVAADDHGDAESFEDGQEAAIGRERAWVRYTSRARHWPRLEKAEARRVLLRLESLLGRIRGFAQARGIKLQTAASEARAAA